MINNEKRNRIKFVAIIAIIMFMRIFAKNILEDGEYEKIDAQESTYQEFCETENIDRVFIDFEEELAKNKFFYTIKNDQVIYTTDYPDTEDFKVQLLEKNIKIYPREDIYDELNIISFVNAVDYDSIDLLLSITMIIVIMSYFMSSMINSSPDKYEKNKGDKSEIKFDDVAGLYEVKKDLKNIVDFLQNGEKYKKAGAELPNGIIFHGPPGTGKTLLAKAIAGEAGVPFFYMNGSDFVELYVGMGAKRVRNLFTEAKKVAPAIIFIDEIDAVGNSRDKGDGNSEDRKTLNALLTEIDGFKSKGDVIVIGATNRLKDIDPALLRAGRFTEQFYIPKPETKEERMDVIILYTKNKKLAEDVDLNQFAKDTLGCSPADIEAILNEAMILAVRNGKEFITNEFLEQAYYKRIVGGHPKEKNDREKEEIEICAIHEAGHTLAGVLLGQDVSKVTIVPSTNGAGGITFTIPKKLGLYSAKELKDRVKCLYAGRIAEYLYKNSWEEVTTGASQDLEEATAIIKDYISRNGMDENVGFIVFNDDKNKEVQEQMKSLSKLLKNETIQLLQNNFDILIELKNKLIEKETLNEEEILNIIKKKKAV